MFTQPRLNARKAIWMTFLSEFEFEVKHIKGKENKVADALSWRTHEVYEITLSEPEIYLLSRIKTVSIQDAEYVNLLNKIQKEEVNLNGIEFRVDYKGLNWFKERIYKPDVVYLKLLISNGMHKPPYAGHPWYRNMITGLRKKFFWTKLKV